MATLVYTADIPGHAWRICRSQKLQILMFCQRSHCREAETELHCKMLDFITQQHFSLPV